jgi:large subunit ribosomal protein L24
MKSSQPRKQRKEMFNAPLHKRQKMIAAHLAKPLIKQFNRRSLPLRKGDEVKVMRGEHSGETGKVSKINLKRLKVYIENIKTKKVSGQEVQIPFHPSNIMITNPVIEDEKRKKILRRKVK